MEKSLLCSLLALVVLCSVPCGVQAEDGETVVVTDPLPPAPTEAVEALPFEEDEPTLPASGAITAVHGYVSGGVEALSRKIDSFFGATRIYEEASGTYVQARGNVIYEKGGDVGFDGAVRARLDLPNLEKKVSLVIESEEEETVSETSVAVASSPAATVDEKKVTTSLQYVVQSTRRWDVRLQPGVRLSLDPDPFVRLRFRLLQPISKTWLTRITVTPGWFDSRGWEARARFDVERGTGGGSLFRASTEGVWLRDEPRDVLITQAFLYTHPWGSRVQMAYQAGVTAEVDPKFQDTEYFSNIRYRRNIHQGWMFLELKPQILFTRDDDFKPDPSFTLTLEILIGGRYL